MAFTEPFITCGVNEAGTADTTDVPWSTLTAEAGSAPVANNVNEAAASPTARRRDPKVMRLLPPRGAADPQAAGPL
ncbi:MAG TPA: hypothetical protein VFX52_04290 [Nocardioidaceae bacterium]|nr:hypothetical protein [Nocardioidaceae bacterium]